LNSFIAFVLGLAVYPVSIGLGSVLYMELPVLHSSNYGIIAAFIFIIAAVVAACIEVYRKEFYKYEVPFTSDPQLAFILLIFFGYFLFPIFIYSWLQIVRKMAAKKTIDYSKPIKKSW